MDYTNTQFGFMNNACNTQKRQTDDTDARLGFMSNSCTGQVKEITQGEVDDFMKLIKTYIGTEDDVEMTADIKNQLIDATMMNISLNIVAKRIADGIVLHNKLIVKLTKGNKPQSRVLVQKDGRVEKGLKNTQALRNTHYNTYMNRRMRFRT